MRKYLLVCLRVLKYVAHLEVKTQDDIFCKQGAKIIVKYEVGGKRGG